MKNFLFTALSLTTIFACGPLRLRADDPSFRISTRTKKVVAGELFYIRYSISSQKGIFLPDIFGRCDGHTFGSMKDVADNSPDSYTWPCLKVGKTISNASYDMVKLSGTMTFEVAIALTPGHYFITGGYQSKGPYIDHYDDLFSPSRKEIHKEVKEIWTGKITAPDRIEIEVVPPAGEDLKALIGIGLDPAKGISAKEYFLELRHHRAKLINHHLESIYGAHAWFGEPASLYNPDYTPEKPENYLARVHQPDFLKVGRCMTDDMGIDIPNPNFKGSCLRLSGKDTKREIVTTGEMILQRHPDFQFADELRLRIALAQIALNEEKKAIEIFQTMAKSADLPMHRELAGRYLALLSREQPIK